MPPIPARLKNLMSNNSNGEMSPEDRWQHNEMVGNALLARRDMINKFLDPRRDIDDECGYKKTNELTSEDYQLLYDRESIATRVVEIMPMESWQVQPKVFETEDVENETEFEMAWDDLAKSLRGDSWFKDQEGNPIWEHLRRADILSGIGHFGVLLLGINDGKDLREPVDGIDEQGRSTRPSKKEKDDEEKFGADAEGDPEDGDSEGKVPVGSDEAEEVEEEEDPKKKKGERPPNLNAKEDEEDEEEEESQRDVKAEEDEQHSESGEDEREAGAEAKERGGTMLTGKGEKGKSAEGEKLVEMFSIRAFPEPLVDITRYEQDKTNRRYGLPVMYNITVNDPSDQHSGLGMPLATVEVHWTRVVHLADNLGSSDIFGVPRQRAVYNRLMDLRKLYGGSAEMYWRGAFPGLSFETHPQLGGDVEIDYTAVRTAADNYMNTLQRYLAVEGMAVKTLSPQVVDPSEQIDTQITAICVKMGIPKRKFMGTERGELASGQDDGDWNDLLQARQNGYITPRIIVPFVDRLILIGVLPEPTEDDGYSVDWPDLKTVTDQEEAQLSLTRTEALTKYLQGQGDTLMSPMDFFVRVWGMEEKEAESVLENAVSHIEQANPDAEGEIVPGRDPKPQMGMGPDGMPMEVGPDGKPLPGKENPFGGGGGGGQFGEEEEEDDDNPFGGGGGGPKKPKPKFPFNQGSGVDVVFNHLAKKYNLTPDELNICKARYLDGIRNHAQHRQEDHGNRSTQQGIDEDGNSVTLVRNPTPAERGERRRIVDGVGDGGKVKTAVAVRGMSLGTRFDTVSGKEIPYAMWRIESGRFKGRSREDSAYGYDVETLPTDNHTPGGKDHDQKKHGKSGGAKKRWANWITTDEIEVESDKVSGGGSSYVTTFKLDDTNRRFEVTIVGSHETGKYSLFMEDNEGSMTKTGLGSAMEVMRKTSQSVSSFIKKHSPKVIHFSGFGDSRRKLYESFTKRVKTIFDGYVGIKSGAGSFEFVKDSALDDFLIDLKRSTSNFIVYNELVTNEEEDWILNHLGPGDHPSGTPQSDHGVKQYPQDRFEFDQRNDPKFLAEQAARAADRAARMRARYADWVAPVEGMSIWKPENGSSSRGTGEIDYDTWFDSEDYQRARESWENDNLSDYYDEAWREIQAEESENLEQELQGNLEADDSTGHFEEMARESLGDEATDDEIEEEARAIRDSTEEELRDGFSDRLVEIMEDRSDEVIERAYEPLGEAWNLLDAEEQMEAGGYDVDDYRVESDDDEVENNIDPNEDREQNFEVSYDVQGRRYNAELTHRSQLPFAANASSVTIDDPVYTLTFTDDQNRYELSGRTESVGEAKEVMIKTARQLSAAMERFRPAAIYFTGAHEKKKGNEELGQRDEEGGRIGLYRFLTKRSKDLYPGYTGVEIKSTNDSNTFIIVKNNLIPALENLPLRESDTQERVIYNVNKKTNDKKDPPTREFIGLNDLFTNGFMPEKFWDELYRELIKPEAIARREAAAEK